MRTRTRLTTPPGQEPSLSTDRRPDAETYVSGLGLPIEPRVPGRRRRLWVTLAVLAVVAVAAYAAFLAATSGQTFDPALDLDAEPGDAATAEVTPDPAVTVPGDG